MDYLLKQFYRGTAASGAALSKKARRLGKDGWLGGRWGEYGGGSSGEVGVAKDAATAEGGGGGGGGGGGETTAAGTAGGGAGGQGGAEAAAAVEIKGAGGAGDSAIAQEESGGDNVPDGDGKGWHQRWDITGTQQPEKPRGVERGASANSSSPPSISWPSIKLCRSASWTSWVFRA